MKKNILKSSYKLKVFNDGSSAYIWTHPWKGWILLANKDISQHVCWNDMYQENNKNNLEKITDIKTKNNQ